MKLKSLSANLPRAGQILKSPLSLRIESLQTERKLYARQISLQIDVLKQAISPRDMPDTIETDKLAKELVFLERSREKLIIHAQFDGIIGSIHFKPGEKIPPFSPIITLHSQSPSYVKGYIAENVYHQIRVQDPMVISSMVERRYQITGHVIGVGSRIITFPTRLLVLPERPLWGREILVHLPAENRFILGEKVLLSATPGAPNTKHQQLSATGKK